MPRRRAASASSCHRCDAGEALSTASRPRMLDPASFASMSSKRHGAAHNCDVRRHPQWQGTSPAYSAAVRNGRRSASVTRKAAVTLAPCSSKDRPLPLACADRPSADSRVSNVMSLFAGPANCIFSWPGPLPAATSRSRLMRLISATPCGASIVPSMWTSAAEGLVQSPRTRARASMRISSRSPTTATLATVSPASANCGHC